MVMIKKHQLLDDFFGDDLQTTENDNLSTFDSDKLSTFDSDKLTTVDSDKIKLTKFLNKN
jgi:hypothetical protein